MAKQKDDIFGDYKDHSLTKPRDLAWSNWKTWDPPQVGDKVQGFIRDVFYRPAEGQFKDQRGITLEQPDGSLINVGIKRLPFILDKTDDLHIGDPLVIELVELKPNAQKGFSPTNIFAFYKPPFDGVKSQKTVRELEAEDMAKGGSLPPVDPEETVTSKTEDEPPFED